MSNYNEELSGLFSSVVGLIGKGVSLGEKIIQGKYASSIAESQADISSSEAIIARSQEKITGYDVMKDKMLSEYQQWEKQTELKTVGVIAAGAVGLVALYLSTR